jgi:hypothetical protein
MAWGNSGKTAVSNNNDEGETVNKPISTLQAQLTKKKEMEAEINDVEFSYDDALLLNDQKLIVTIYGSKNDSKTTTAYGMMESGDKIIVLSFDNKSKRPIDELDFIKNSGCEFEVLNAVKYYNKEDTDTLLLTAEMTWKLINYLLKEAAKRNPDWILIDGTEILNGILEMVMRKRNGLSPYQGIANLNVWKERRQYLDDIHNKARDIAKKGLIYTSYIDKDEVIRDGAVIKKKDMPKWIGNMLTETDIVVRVETIYMSDKRKFMARIESSKMPSKWPEAEYDITGKRLYDVVNEGGVIG